MSVRGGKKKNKRNALNRVLLLEQPETPCGLCAYQSAETVRAKYSVNFHSFPLLGPVHSREQGERLSTPHPATLIALPLPPPPTIWESKRGEYLEWQKQKKKNEEEEEEYQHYTVSTHSISFNPYRLLQGKYHGLWFGNEETKAL